MNKYNFKICLIGDEGVGKLAIVEQLVDRKFYHEIRPIKDIDESFFVKKYDEIDLFIFHFHYEIPLMKYNLTNVTVRKLRGLFGLLFVYDITSQKSFENLEKYIRLYQIVANLEKQKITKILIACKSDLEEKRVVLEEIARGFAFDHDIDIFIECSAKNGKNIEEIFHSLILKIKQLNKGLFISEEREKI